MGNSRLKPLICVGVAYFIVAIIVPVLVLASQGELRGDWTFAGMSWSLIGGRGGSLRRDRDRAGAVVRGRPIYVMPLVFGGAPVVNTLFTMYWTKAYKEGVSPIFYAGLILVIAGAATVLVFAPKAHRHQPATPRNRRRPATAGHRSWLDRRTDFDQSSARSLQSTLRTSVDMTPCASRRSIVRSRVKGS